MNLVCERCEKKTTCENSCSHEEYRQREEKVKQEIKEFYFRVYRKHLKWQ